MKTNKFRYLYRLEHISNRCGVFSDVNGFDLLMCGIDLSVLNYHTTPLEDMEINMVFIDDKDYVIMDDGREIELNKFKFFCESEEDVRNYFKLILKNLNNFTIGKYLVNTNNTIVTKHQSLSLSTDINHICDIKL